MINNDADKPLAFRYWPLEANEKYWENDLNNEEKVEVLFDYSQILEVVITNKGWSYLIQHYGFEKLFEIDKRSGWFECETLEEFKLCVEHEMSYGL